MKIRLNRLLAPGQPGGTSPKSHRRGDRHGPGGRARPKRGGREAKTEGTSRAMARSTLRREARMGRLFYRLARLSRDLKSLSGPEKFAKRQIRKPMIKWAMRIINRIVGR